MKRSGVIGTLLHEITFDIFETLLIEINNPKLYGAFKMNFKYLKSTAIHAEEQLIHVTLLSLLL